MKPLIVNYYYTVIIVHTLIIVDVYIIMKTLTVKLLLRLLL